MSFRALALSDEAFDEFDELVDPFVREESPDEDDEEMVVRFEERLLLGAYDAHPRLSVLRWAEPEQLVEAAKLDERNRATRRH